jgi:hypothetical protein
MAAAAELIAQLDGVFAQAKNMLEAIRDRY